MIYSQPTLLPLPLKRHEAAIINADYCKRRLPAALFVTTELLSTATACSRSEIYRNLQGKPVNTIATEFRLLEHFARHLGRIFTRDQLLDSVWRDTAFVTPRSVDVYVRRIREKIEPDPENPRYLKTVRGTGYRLEAPK
jgi:DNA-binding response OmpR family regulator